MRPTLCLLMTLALVTLSHAQSRVESLAFPEPSTLELPDPFDVPTGTPQAPDWLDWSDGERPTASSPRASRSMPTRLPVVERPASAGEDPVSAASIGRPPTSPPQPLELRLSDGDPALPLGGVQNAGPALGVNQPAAVRTIPTVVEHRHRPTRVVRYEVALDDHESHEVFGLRGVEGELIEVPVPLHIEGGTAFDRFKRRCQGFFGMLDEKEYPRRSRVIRYEVPADDIAFHAAMSDLDGELMEPGMLRLPEVRFFQPKARVFMDLKRDNDSEFDLFSNGAVLASLDVVELYFPMPLISERFSRAFGKPNRLSWLGWRVGGTLGVGVTTALNNGDAANGSAPITTFSSGLRYEFPLGRPSLELIETQDPRLDQRTRVGIETGFQGGISTNESLGDSTDYGFYLGILVNTPWNGYGG